LAHTKKKFRWLLPATLGKDGMSTIDDDNQIFFVVVNDEGQHSIWPDFKPVPAGWRENGFKGVKKDCLEHIATVWTDMRPLSLQRTDPGAQS